MNKNIILSFWLWVITTWVFFSFIYFIIIPNAQLEKTPSSQENLDIIPTSSHNLDVALKVNNEYQQILSSESSDIFLSKFQSDYTKIIDSIKKWETTFYDVERLDVYVPFLVRCNIFSQNLNNIEKLKTEIWESLDIFLIDNSGWFYPNNFIESYNNNFITFSTTAQYTLSQFFNTMNQFQWTFHSTESDFANNLAKLYSRFYNELESHSLSNKTFNCEEFFVENVFWLERS